MGKMQEAKANDQVAFAPVVKKGGMVGLRNVLASSFATVQYDEKFSHANYFTSPASLRSSNLLSMKSEGTMNLSEEEKLLTRENIFQILDICPRVKENSQAYPWPTLNKPLVMFQTLLRQVGGGDTHVIRHKDAILDALKKENAEYNDVVVYSNHSIGATLEARKLEDLTRQTNTIGVDHVKQPVKNFVSEVIKDKVLTVKFSNEIKALRLEQAATSDEKQKKKFDDNVGVFTDLLPELFKKLDVLVDKAALGNLKPNDISEKLRNFLRDEKHPELDRGLALTRILFALNNYAVVEKEKSHSRNYQLHLAALEEIIYEDTGNLFHSSCKSGKDREGIQKCYKNALRAYFDEYKDFPPLKEPAKNRKKFIEIFVDLFQSNHQAYLAELNANGCKGLKALKNILPKDIYPVLKDLGVLETHANNSSLNQLGHAKVKADSKTKVSYLKIDSAEMAELNALNKDAEDSAGEEEDLADFKMAGNNDRVRLEMLRRDSPPSSRSPSPPVASLGEEDDIEAAATRDRSKTTLNVPRQPPKKPGHTRTHTRPREDFMTGVLGGVAPDLKKSGPVVMRSSSTKITGALLGAAALAIPKAALAAAADDKTPPSSDDDVPPPPPRSTSTSDADRPPPPPAGPPPLDPSSSDDEPDFVVTRPRN